MFCSPCGKKNQSIAEYLFQFALLRNKHIHESKQNPERDFLPQSVAEGFYNGLCGSIRQVSIQNLTEAFVA